MMPRLASHPSLLENLSRLMPKLSSVTVEANRRDFAFPSRAKKGDKATE